MKRPAPLLAGWLALGLLAAGPLGAADKNGVAPTVVSLPGGPGSVEGLGPGFEPLLNTGSARYEVKIALPPGVGGAAPALALRYESGRGDGPAGIGWGFGPGGISRAVERGLPRYVDGPNGLDDDGDGVPDNPEEQDLFTGLDGEELTEAAAGTWRARAEERFTRYRRVGDHWEADLRDGTRLELGVTSAGRVADPSGTRVFRWLPERSTDRNGNVVEYRWVSAQGSDAQRYLAEIRYAAGAPPWPAYAFAALTYEDRPDWRADYRPGFLVKTAQRLARIDVGVHGVAPAGCLAGDWNGDGETDALVARYDLAYDPAHPRRSLLRSVTRYGSDGVSYLPPVRFSYAAFEPPWAVSAAEAVIGSDNAPPAAMDSDLVELVDLNRDGLPDILATEREGGAHTVSLNLGEAARPGGGSAVRWDAPRTVASADGLAPLLHLDEATVHLADMDGDGIADLVHTTAAGEVFWHANLGTAAWGERQRMSTGDTAPPPPFGSRDAALSDLDFDKRTDVVLSTDNGYAVWFNLDGGRYVREARTDGAVWNGRVIRFSDPGVQLADMNGDRLNDVVRVTPSRLVVAAGLGRGTFAPAVEIPIPDETLTDGPGGQVSRARLADIDGDGLADLVVERAAGGELHAWLNRGTNALSPRIVVQGMPAVYGASTAVRWADVNGNGTVDLVYADSSAAERLRAVDLGLLIGATDHANLLFRIENGLGVTTDISWVASTSQYLADRASRPWATTLPFPVPVVATVEADTGLDLDGVPGTDRIRRTFAYRDGFYEDRDHAFRGFGEVRATDEGDESAPTLATVVGFFTGGPDGADNDGDGAVDEVAGRGQREEEALAGKIRFSESRTASDTLLVREENAWRARTLAAAPDGTEVRYAIQERADRLVHEGGATPVTVRTEYGRDDFGNLTAELRYGALSLQHDEVFRHAEYANDAARWVIGLPVREWTTDADGVVAAETYSYYDGAEYAGLPLGQVDRGNLTRRIARVSDAAFVDQVRYARDAWGNVERSLDPNGNLRTVTWDPLFHARPVAERLAVGGGSPDLVVAAAYHDGFGALTSSTDFNGERTDFAYDSFGRLASVVKPGDSMGLPTLSFSYRMADPAGALTYDYAADGTLTLVPGPATASAVATRAREVSGQAGTWDVVKYTDGLGRALATVSEAESGFVVAGATRFNARGGARFVLQPYTAAGAAYAAPPAGSPATEWRYDALGREVRRVNPPDAVGALTHADTAWSPLARTLTDEESKVRDLFEDGLGRTIEVRSHLGAALLSTRTAYDPLGRPVTVVDPLGNTRVTAYDGLGRVSVVDDPDRGRLQFAYDAAGNLVQRRDNRGRVVLRTYDGANRVQTEQHVGAAGAAVVWHYDRPSPDYPGAARLAGRLAWVEDEAGAEFLSYDARGNVAGRVRRIRSGGTDRDFASARAYDALDRPVRETWPDGDFVEFVYNAAGLLEAIPAVVDDVDYTPAGTVARIAYANGVATDSGYDPRGRLTSLTAAPAAGATLQQLQYALDGVGNVLSVTDLRAVVVDPLTDADQAYGYDDLHRLTGAQGPHGTLAFGYDAIGNMTSAGSPAGAGHIADPLVNLGTLAYGGAAGTSGRGLRAPGAAPGPHAVTSTASGLAYAYDDDGNMTGRATDAYAWDANDRMAAATVGTGTTRYLRDPAGRRVVRETTDGAATSRTWYVSEGYEVRDGVAFKSVFAGARRVAVIDGRLQPGAASGSQAIALAAGWNFIALELEPANPAVGAVLAPIAGQYDAVYEFDATAQGWAVPTELHARRGYAIHALQETGLDVAGAASPLPITLAAGWNLVPCPADNAVAAAGAYAAAAPAAIWAYDAASGQWEAWEAAPAGGVPPLGQVAPGRAYWVHAGSAAAVPVAARPTRVFFLHPDHLGSVAVVTDAGGSVVARNEYYPHGRIRHAVRAGFDPPWAFTGAEIDGETGLLALGARQLDPVTGRFLSVDPALADPYAYAWDNPLRFRDVAGLYGTDDLNRQIGAPPPSDYKPGDETKSLSGSAKDTGEKLADISLQDVANYLVKELAKSLVGALMKQLGSPVLAQLATNLVDSDLLNVDYALNEAWGAIDSDVMSKPIAGQLAAAGGDGLASTVSGVGGALAPVGKVAGSALDITGNALGFVGSLPGGTFISNPIAEKMQSLERGITSPVADRLAEVNQIADRVNGATVAPTGPNMFWQGNATSKMIVLLGLAKGMDQFVPTP